MPSEPRSAPRWLVLLRSQGLGVLCGQATVLLLAVGSVLIARGREGTYAGLQLDDLRFFLERPSWWHLWAYALFGVMGLYALNTVLCTWESVTRRWALGVRSVSAYGPAVMHVAFLVAMLAHLVGGLWSVDYPPAAVGPAFRPLPDGREARLLDLEVDSHPDGSPKQVRARVEVRHPDGRISAQTVGFNGPHSEGLGSDLLLILRFWEEPAAVRLAAGEARCETLLGEGCALGALQVRLAGFQELGEPGTATVARLLLLRPGQPPEPLALFAGQRHTASDGTALHLERIERRPVVLLRGRHAPGDPWALLSALLLTLGVGMMGRRWL